jgi:iron complex outermembrane receptor protein
MTGLMLATGSFAQNITVKGIVTDAEKDPVTGANIVEKGTTNGIITDLNGNFTLSTAPDAVIVISYIGYKTQEIKASTQFAEITLEEDLEILDEVVVIGYGSVKKNDATGSVTAIKPDMINRGLTTNAQDLMIGKIAGVSVITDGGAPGGGASIRIRGGSSLNASNDPLIVIDGLTMDNDGVKGLANPLSMVNPNDIETFTVLKDASATAIYGSRASNGVIIITTKKGQVSEDSGITAHVTYDGNVSMSNVRKTLDVMGAGEYRDLIRETYGEGSDAWKALGSANTDWQDEIYRTALSTDHNVSVYGGVNAVPYRLSIGYTKQNGIVQTSGFERYTATLNVSPSFLENRLKFNGNLKAMHAGSRYADGGAVGSSVVMDPTQPVRMTGDDYAKYFGGYFQWTSSGASLNDPAWALTTNSLAPANPVATLDLKDDRARSKSLVGNLEADYAFEFLSGLRAHANGGMDLSTGKQTTDVSPYSFSNNYYGSFGYEKVDKYNLSLNAYMQYMRTVGVHGIDVMAGYEWQHFHRKGNSRYTGFYRPTHAESPGREYQPSVKEWASENYLVSFFGRVNYSLMERYLFTATVRHDGSSRFSKENRWGTFPSFAFGWKVKEEGFLRDVGELSDLKLRLGYGLTGQQNIGSNYAYFASYTANKAGAYYPIGYGKGETYRPDAYNKNLKWERTETYNAGVDFGFLNGRISGAADCYFRRTTDLINDVYVSAGTNFKNRVLANIGSLENRGVELALNVKPVATKGFVWDAGFNITYNNSKITKLTSGTGEGYYVMTGGLSANTGATCQAHAVGYPAYSFYVYQQVYDGKGRPIENLFVDRNGDGSINESDLYLYKKPAADVLMGFTSKFICGHWDASFSLRASLNNYVYNDVESNSSNMKMLYAPSGFLINRPRMALANRWEGLGNYYLSDYFVRNASFLKCDNVTVGYSFDSLLGRRMSGRVYAAVQNVFTVTKYGGIDPEISMSLDMNGNSKAGIDRDIYPRPLVSLVGLTLNF